MARKISEDNEIKFTNSNNLQTDIILNNIQNGTYKTIPVLIEQDVIKYTNAYKNKLTGINSIVFTATHVAEDGTKTNIEKTVDLKVDWYGEKRLGAIDLRKTSYVASKKDNQVIIGVEAQLWSQVGNDTATN